MYLLRQGRFCFSLACMLLLTLSAESATVRVHCGTSTNATINGALHHLGLHGPNTIIVSGTCHENVLIQSFDRLTLQAESGASIDDPSNGNGPTVTILDSQRVAIQGFTINGGSPGILCGDYSLCRFSQNTVQNTADNGVFIVRSRAEFAGDVIQNNPARGLVLREQSTARISGVTLQGNPNAGADVHDGSFLYSLQSTIQNNGFGIRSEQSTLRIELSTIGNNSLDGVQLQEGSTAWFAVLAGPNTIIGSGFEGVSVNDLSFAAFDPGNSITGSLQPPDVVCNPQYSATRGATTNIGGGTTNCAEPGTSQSRKR